MDIYEAPKSEIMEGANKFLGGSLKFYYYINFIWLLILPLGLLAYAVLSIIESENLFYSYEVLFYFIEILPDFIFSLLILRIIKLQSSQTPNKIKRLMAFELLAKCLIGIAIFIAYENGITDEKPFPFFMSVIYYLIWAYYFKKSKRVLNYYGENAK